MMSPFMKRADACADLHPNDVFGRLFRDCEHLPAVRCAVVHPCDKDSLKGALEAAKLGLIIETAAAPTSVIQPPPSPPESSATT